MIDFKEIKAREALRDFIKTALQRKGKDPLWLVDRSRLSRETVVDRMLASDQSNKPAPRQSTLNRLFAALDCRFEDFEAHYLGSADNQQPDDLSELRSLVGEMRRLVAQSGSLQGGRTPTQGGESWMPLGEATSDPISAKGERRRLTVVMFELADWSALSQRLDPEELAEVLVSYRNLCAEKVDELGGTVAECVGDGVLAYFGYPTAREDDAECAVRAAMATIAANGKIKVEGEPIGIRCGVATGSMVVGQLAGQTDMGRFGSRSSTREPTVVGEAPDLAARLGKLAEPNSVVISEATQRLVREMFCYRDRGEARVEGLEKPLRIWQVESERAIRSRFYALRSPLLSRLVGRGDELEALSRLWDAARSGKGQVVMVSGEAGIGKSRLVEAVAEQVVSSAARQLWFYCSPHLQNSALAPIINQLKSAAQLGSKDSQPEKLAKLERVVPQTLADRSEALALYSKLLAIESGDRYPLEPMSPQKERRRLFDAFSRMLATLTDDRPVLLVFEDLHWIDPSSDELLGRLLQEIPSLPVLAVVTARPEARSHWEHLENAVDLRLEPLDRADSQALILEVANHGNLPNEIVTRIIEKSDGIPLFIEDVTHDLVQSLGARDDGQGSTTKPAWEIPNTLHDALMSRLDRLGGDAKRVVQIGSVIGREFSFHLLADVLEAHSRGTREILAQLERADVLYVRRTPAALVYIFKHALVQDAAYSSLLKRERRDLHRRVAEVLEQDYAEVCEQTPELLGLHFEEAGEYLRAIAYWLAAGKLSAQRSSFVEALGHLDRALALTRVLPPSELCTRTQIGVLIAIGAAQAAYRGFSAAESGAAYEQALELCRDLKNPPELCQILSGAGSYHITRAEFAVCGDLAERCLDCAGQQADDPPFVMGHRLAGATLLLTGEIGKSVEQLEEALRRYESSPEQYRHPDSLGVQDHKSTVCCYLGLAHTALGNLDRGLDFVRSGLAHAEALGQLHTVNFSLTYLAAVHHFRREHQQVLEYAGRSYRMALEQGFGTWVGIAQMMIGAALVRSGDPAQGMREITSGIEAYSAIDAKTYQPFGISLLAKSLLAVGKLDDAMGAVENALAVADSTGEHWYVPELWRLKGAVLIELENTLDAEQCLRHSITLARQSGALFWELRAAKMLARSLGQQGRVAEATGIVTPPFERFTEGVDVPDLCEARELLESLRQQAD